MSTEPRPDLDDEPEIREHLTSGVTRAQLDRELRRGVGPAILVVGLVALSALVFFQIVRNVSSGRSPLAGQYEVRVAVPDATGVVAKVQEVRIAGLQVGRISESELVDGRPVLTLRIEERFGHLYRDAKLRLRPQTPLNDLYIDVLDRGTRSAGRADPSTMLPTSSTSVPVQFSQALNIFRPVSRERMQTFIAQFGPALGDGGDQLRAAFVELAPFLRASDRLASDLATRRTATRRLVSNLRLMLDELADRDRNIRGLVADGARTMNTIGENSAPFDALLRELPSVVGQARSTFTTLAPTLDRARLAFDALQPVAEELPSSLRALTAFSDDATPAFTRLRPAVRALDPLVGQLRPLARTLTGAFSDLQPSVPRLESVARQVDGCHNAVQGFFMDTMSVLKFEDDKHAIPRGELVAQGPGQLVAPESCAPGRPRK